jgi:hypothetical protein
MSSKIPFAVQPLNKGSRRLGNESTGIIEMPIRGGLTTGEDRVIAELLEDHEDLEKAEAELCDLIATSEGITLMEARQIILDRISKKEQPPTADAIAVKYAKAIGEHQSLTRKFGYMLIDATVTAMMRVRLGTKEWTMEDTQTGLDRMLYMAIWEFAQEETASERRGQSDKPVVSEDSLGKPSAARPARKRTGKESIGN